MAVSTINKKWNRPVIVWTDDQHARARHIYEFCLKNISTTSSWIRSEFLCFRKVNQLVAIRSTTIGSPKLIFFGVSGMLHPYNNANGKETKKNQERIWRWCFFLGVRHDRLKVNRWSLTVFYYQPTSLFDHHRSRAHRLKYSGMRIIAAVESVRSISKHIFFVCVCVCFMEKEESVSHNMHTLIGFFPLLSGSLVSWLADWLISSFSF